MRRGQPLAHSSLKQLYMVDAGKSWRENERERELSRSETHTLSETESRDSFLRALSLRGKASGLWQKLSLTIVPKKREREKKLPSGREEKRRRWPVVVSRHSAEAALL